MIDLQKMLRARPREEILGTLGNPSRISLRTGLLMWFLGISLMPLFHIGGIIIHAYLYYQAVTAVFMKFFDPKELLETIEKEKITNYERILE